MVLADNIKIKSNNSLKGSLRWLSLYKQYTFCVLQKACAGWLRIVGEFNWRNLFAESVCFLIPSNNYCFNSLCVIRNFNAPNKRPANFKKRAMKYLLMTPFLLIYGISNGQNNLKEIDGACYQDHTNFSNRGIVGTFKGRTIFYEVWQESGIVGTSTNQLILRTDTTYIDSLNFCLDTEQGDTITFTKLIDTLGWVTDSTMTIDKFPTLFQPLVYGDYGFQSFLEFNKDEQTSQRIYFEGNYLYLQYWMNTNVDEHKLFRRRYDFDGKYFKLVKEELLESLEEDK
jgi:hypothetical protein